MQGNGLDTLFFLNNCRTKRISSYDRSGGNHDWLDVPAGETGTVAEIEGSGIIRHIWCTHGVADASGGKEANSLRKLVLRMYWDGETEPSVEAPLGDFFGAGPGPTKSYWSAAFAVTPQDGRGMNCYLPMPFLYGARITLENACDNSCNFYYYIDYEEYDSLPAGEIGHFHASWRREADTMGWAPKDPGLMEREKANLPEEPAGWPRIWTAKNTDGKDNYIVLEAEGRGKFVGCNMTVDVFERQANPWYGEGDDMFFIDGEEWPPTLHGTGTEDYFCTAYCPTQPYAAPYSGLIRYEGEEAGFRWGGRSSMYRLHILDPICFEKSLKFSIEHGHANLLSNDYTSTAYWYQTEPHKPFAPLPPVEERLPRPRAWEAKE